MIQNSRGSRNQIINGVITLNTTALVVRLHQALKNNPQPVTNTMRPRQTTMMCKVAQKERKPKSVNRAW